MSPDARQRMLLLLGWTLVYLARALEWARIWWNTACLMRASNRLLGEDERGVHARLVYR